jgi:type 1 fimbriae regulatory protein FimB
MMYRHGLRASEVVAIQLRDINLVEARLMVRRLQGGRSVEHPIPADELKAIERYVIAHRLPSREIDWDRGEHVPRRGWRKRLLEWEGPLFVNRRGEPLTRHGVHRIVAGAAFRAGLQDVGPLTLRLSCGHALAAKGVDLATIQDYLGLCNPRHARRFKEIAGRRFEGLWG